MFSSVTVLSIFLCYMLTLLLLALWAERRAVAGIRIADNPVVYSLSLTVYCTAWTFYGNVGIAGKSGLLFLTVYLAPTCAMFLWWVIVRKMIRIKNHYHITSLADLISTRYGKSPSLGAIVSVGALLGTIPYISLQLKSVITTFQMITVESSPTPITENLDLIVIVILIAFIIAFGLHKLDPSERHQGMMVVIAAESVIKLVALVSVGVFVTFFLFDGFGDIFARLPEKHIFGEIDPSYMGYTASSYITWFTMFLLSASAIVLLPRQFHVAVVENSDEKHLATAMWLFPLYLILITIFVLPIAMAGRIKGLPREMSDFFVLLLPLKNGQRMLSLAVFLGGFSASSGMIMITAMTMAIMISNYLLLPIIEGVKRLNFLRRYLLQLRWITVAAYIFTSFVFYRFISETELLVNIGIISFAAVLQFAPAAIGGLFWRKANKLGAISGLIAGFVIWLYTIILPDFIKSGLLPDVLLEGPWSLSFLRPECLFGLKALEPLPHAIFWSMFFNLGFFVFFSLFSGQDESESETAREFTEVLTQKNPYTRSISLKTEIDLDKKIVLFREVLEKIFPEENAKAIVSNSLHQIGVQKKKNISIMELANIVEKTETSLAGVIGSAAAHRAMRQANIYSVEEKAQLSRVYSEMIASMQISPLELREKINYFREKEELLSDHARQLEKKVVERDHEIEIRKEAEQLLRDSEKRFRQLSQATWEAIVIHTDGVVLQANDQFFEMFEYWPEEIIGERALTRIVTEESLQSIRKQVAEGSPGPYQAIALKKDGREFKVEIRTRSLQSREREIMVVAIRDITDRVRMEEMMLQTEKMMSVGGLAAGMAHEINNPLAGILQSIQVFKNRLLTPLAKNQAVAKECGTSLEAIRAYVEKRKLSKLMQNIIDSGHRAAKIVEDMLSFSRQSESSYTCTDMAELLDKTLELALREYNLKTKFDFRKIEILREYRPALKVLCDPPKLQQVFLNILQNGAQAMFGAKAASKEKKQMQFVLRIGRKNDMTRIEIQDNGPGMDEITVKRLFEPFYTTKPVGEGTGLGLSVSYFIITENHSGTISVDSSPGKGANFIIDLPASPPTHKG